jgi:hypothetical protein
LDARDDSGSGLGSPIEQVEEFKPGDIHGIGSLQITLSFRLQLKLRDSDPVAKEVTLNWQICQLVQRSLHHVVPVSLSDLSLRVDDLFGKQIWTVQVDIWVEVFAAEHLDDGGKALRNVAVANAFLTT